MSEDMDRLFEGTAGAARTLGGTGSGIRRRRVRSATETLLNPLSLDFFNQRLTSCTCSNRINKSKR